MSCGGILHLGRMDNLVAEDAAQLCRCSEDGLSAKQLTELDFHAGHGEISHASPVLELNEDINVTLGTEPVCQNRPEKREFANPISLAEVIYEIWIELDVR